MNYQDYPVQVVEDIVRLRRRIEKSGMPPKLTDYNILIGTWNVRAFGKIASKWTESAKTPKRNLRAMACIAEIVSHFDVIAIQEVKGDTQGIRTLIDKFLGPDWGLILSDVSGGEKGNDERLAYLYDKRRVTPSGLAGEIVLPSKNGVPLGEQFDRTPYIVGFRAAEENFAMLTAHIRYGKVPTDRISEIQALADYTANEIRSRAKVSGEESNLIVLGDFNIDDRGTNPLFLAFVSTGLFVPEQLLNLKTTYNTKPKFYDQIAWFAGDMSLNFSEKAGVIDFAGAVFKELSIEDMTYRMSDHFPLWAEFIIDRSRETMAKTIGADVANPQPFAGIPD